MGPGNRVSSSSGHGAGEAGGIVTEDSPGWIRDPAVRGLTVGDIGDKYLLAAQADMSFSGAQVNVVDGRLVVVED
jgi:hypothetical protein